MTVLPGIVIIGGGGHAKAVADVIRSTRKFRVIGFTDPRPGSPLGGCDIPCLGDDAILEEVAGGGVPYAAMGVGGFDNLRRQSIYDRVVALGLCFPTLIHRRAVVSPHASLGAGTVVMPGAVIQSGARIGTNVVVNTGAVVEHDCVVGQSAFIASGAVLCGGVGIGQRSFVGAGACVTQGRSVGEDSTVGAGAVVLSDVEHGRTVVGNPARNLSAESRRP